MKSKSRITKDVLIIKIYQRLARRLNQEPTVGDMTNIGVNRSMIRYYFGNMTNLKANAGKLPGIKAKITELEVIYKTLGVKNVK